MILNSPPAQYTQYDKIIIGGGVFGLSYALAIIEHDLAQRVLIIESRTQYYHDRNWCFWFDEDVPDYVADLITQTYQYSSFDDGNQQHTLTHFELPYCRLASSTFYDYALTKIDHSDSVDLVLGWQADPDEFPFEKLLDARGAWQQPDKTKNMIQAFVGLTVSVPEHVYPLNTATIMGDMRVVKDAKGEHFVFDYILPLNETELLIEVTTFSANPPNVTTLKHWTLNRLKQDFESFEIIAMEHAFLPMDTKVHDTSGKAGAHSGMMRPATGYAFVQIQRQVFSLLGLSPKSSDLGKVTHYMDGVFLRVIKEQPSLCPTIFMQMVSTMKPRDFIAFMNNRLSLELWWEVIRSVPKRPFIKNVLR